MKYTIILAVFLVLAASSNARVLTFIDEFNDIQPPLFISVLYGNDDTYPYDWWSPYYQYGSYSGGLPAALFFDTTQALGGQRDSILGYEGVSPTGSVALVTIVGDSASVAFPLNYVGGAYFQWDGDDAAGGANVFPGATLNSLPGIGNGEPISVDNQTIDFTFGGRGAGIFIQISADHEIFYFFDVVDSLGNTNEFDFTVDPTQGEDQDLDFFIRFNDPEWDNASFDFTDVAGFQVRIFTFSEQGVGAIDTEFRFLRIFGYEISGTVTIDCLCDGVTDVTPVVGEQINLFNFGNPTIIDTAFTDINGDYLFDNNENILTDGSYTVCLDNQVQDVCPSSPTCIDVVLANLVDSLDNDFFITTETTLSIPADVTLECGDCVDPACTGFATVSGCSGGATQINDFTDDVSVFGCTETILRTWVDPESLISGVQTIIRIDTQAPVITTPAQDSLLNDCAVPVETLAQYTARFGGATATDCSAFSFSFPPTSIGPCNSVTITFTATDVCGFSSQTTGTYSTVDNNAPFYDVEPQNDSAECNLKTGSSDTALATWVANRGFSSVSDDCTSSGLIIFANDFVGFPSGCFDSEVVTYSATDSCGNTSLATASFTISDNTNPSFVSLPVDLTSECSSVANVNDDDFRSWLAINGGASATDDCIANDNNLIFTNDATGSLVGGANTCSEQQFVIFTVTDNCGFSSSASAVFTVQDTLAPFITTPATPLTVQCDGAGNVSDYNTFVSTNAGATVSDACDSGIVFSNDAGPAPTGCSNGISVTFSATDFCGVGTASTTATYTVVDNEAPFFVNSPVDITSECDSVQTQSDFDSWLASNAFASGDDACDSINVTVQNNFVGGSISVFCNNVIAVGFNVVDNCGNQSPTETATFTIVDTFAPVISPQASNLSVSCDLSTNQADYNNWLATNGGASATDSCGGVSFSNDAGPITSDCSVSNSVIFTATDACGNSSFTTAQFSIVDNDLPVMVSPAADLTVECNGTGNTNDLNNWLNSRGGFTATDTCSAVSYTDDFVALSGGCVSSSLVTFTGCDSCNNCIFSSATFTIQDTLGPSIAPPAASQIVECDPSSNSNQYQDFVDTQGGADAVDLCDSSALVWTDNAVASPFGCNSEEVTFTVTDGCGFTSSTTATFTILDSIAPVFNPAPVDLIVECDGSGNISDYQNWVSTNAGAFADDACAIFLTFTNSAAIDGPVGCGSEIAVITVEDECGNAASDTAVYQVIDSFPPTFSPAASDMTVECDIDQNTDQLTNWLDTNAGAAAFDTCYGSNVSFSNDFTILIPDLCVSSATVEFTATDPCGQFAVTTATFTIDDTQPPTITTPASNALFECDSTTNNDIQNYLNNNGETVAVDSCSFVTYTNDFVDSPDECNGPIPVTFTATDLCGNFVSSTGSIEIDDTIEPSFFNFPIDRTILCDESSDPSQTGTPSASDSCDSDVDISFSDISIQEPDERLCPGDTIITRTWLAIDDCGNIATQDQFITITIPVGDCIFTPCPPCGSQVCCESSIQPVPCNPVACNPVPCTTTECGSVPCLPVVCGGSAVPIFDDDDDYFPVPTVTAAPNPVDCEPVYIYVFDDDEGIPVAGDPVQADDSSSDASSVFISFFVIAFALFALL